MWWIWFGCAGGLGGGARSAVDFLPPWAVETRFRPVESADAPVDTAAFMGETWSGWVSGTGPWRWEVVEGDDPDAGAPVVALDFSGDDELLLVDPPITLLPSRFSDGEQVAEGATNVTVVVHKDLPTWYGVVPEVVELQLVGQLTGTLTLAPGLGPVQFSLFGQTGDLAWYR